MLICANIHSQTLGGMEEAILSLETRSQRWLGRWDFVKTSAS